MIRYSPIIMAVLLIVGLTYIEVNMTDRLAGTNVSAEQRAALLDKVPTTVGDWRGDDVESARHVSRALWHCEDD